MTYRRANKERNRLYGVPEEDACVDVSVLADEVRSQLFISIRGSETECRHLDLDICPNLYFILYELIEI